MEEIHSAACTIRHWRGYIQNSWKYGKSNNFSEGLKNKVKFLKRVAFGRHSFKGFLKRILLTRGKLRLSNDPLSILEKAKDGKEKNRMYCQSYANGRLDVAIPDPVTRLKERCEDLKDLITDLRVDIGYLQGLCDDYERILKEHSPL